MTLLERLDRFPPFLVRLCARAGHGHRRLTVRQIAERSGLSKSTVANLAVQTSWEHCTIHQIEAFTRGCGVDLFHLKDHRKFLRERKWAYLYRSTKAERAYYGRLLAMA